MKRKPLPKKRKSLVFLVFILVAYAFYNYLGNEMQKNSRESFTYKAVKIYDGDTFLATDGNVKFKVRIAGIDAPEMKQKFGKLSKEKLKNLILNQSIKIEPVGKGVGFHGRTLGLITLTEKNIDVGSQLLKEGLAYYYRPKCNDYPLDKELYNYSPHRYVRMEAIAKTNHINIWSEEKLLMPCEFRKRKN